MDLHRILQDKIRRIQSQLFDLKKKADAIENAVKQVLKDGYRTIDIMDEGKTQVGTIQMGDLIAERI